MKLTDLSIAGFGVWSGLELAQLSPGLTVICGPNEAGKTTIVECLRGVLYGFTPARRQKYLPPLHGGVGGGQVRLAAGDGNFEVLRLDDGARLLGGVTVTAPDGTTQGEPQLKDLLAGIDETLFTNVFAVGLRELQELATLNDSQAAEWLYDLSTGLDGISLADVLGELKSARNRLLADDGGKSQVLELLTQREALAREITELSALTPRYWRLSDDRDAMDEAVRAAEASVEQTCAEVRKVETAIALREPWQLRAQLEEKLASYGRLGEFPAGALRRFERIAGALRKARRRRARIGERRRRLREKRRAIQVNEKLWRQAPRVAALAEHETWLASLDAQLTEAQKQLADCERQLSAARAPYGLADLGSRTLDKQAVTALRAPAALVADARKQLKLVQEECRTIRDNTVEGQDEVKQALARREEKSLAEALERQGQLVADYRRRLQLDDRLDQMALHRNELEEKQRQLIDKQLMPLWLLVTIATVFVAGGGLVLAGIIIPWGIAATVLGAVIAGGAVAGKIGIEQSAAKRLDATGKHLHMLERQFGQAKDERRELDEQLPSGGGSLTSRLQAAESELASLEELLSADARAQAAKDEAAAAKERLKSASENWDHARGQWQTALGEAGLPGNLSPQQVKQLIAGRRATAELAQKHEQARANLDRLQREERAVAARIEQLWTDGGLMAPAVDTPVALVERLQRLRRELAAQEELVRQRGQCDERLDRLRRLSGKYARRARRLARLRRRLIAAAGAIDEADFRRRARERAELNDVLQRHRAIADQIRAALAGHCTEQDVAELVAISPDEAGRRRDNLLARRQAAGDEIKRLAEERGRIAQEQTALTDDRRLGQKQLELNVVEQRLADAIARWRTVAATERLLTSVKQDYERNRQPEVLAEASQYLEQMSEGRYGRVWTPVDEHALRVDEKDRSLPIELLSTGAREQLFLCLRLALVSRYARHGKPMPLVLDDVLVNFDPARAQAAASVIAGYARAGHQLLMFTCHEHIAQLFVALREDVRRLPGNGDASRKIVGPSVRESEAASEPPRRRKERRAKETPSTEQLRAVEDSTPVLVAADEAETATIATDEFAVAPQVETVQVLAAPPATNSLVDHAAVPAETSPPKPLDAAAASKPARRRRADRPHAMAPYKARRRKRWLAEEFDGELEDKVNAAFEKAAWSAVEKEIDEGHSSSNDGA